MTHRHSRRPFGSAAPWLVAVILAGAFILAAHSAVAKEFVFGVQTDRSGPTQTIGPFVGDGCQDYIRLFNKKKVLGKHTLRAYEIEHGYNVPRSIEAYERHKQAGALSIGLYGTPHTVALTPKLTEDRVLGTSPGFGSADAANGEKYPYIFPIAASYWSQMGGAVKFIMDHWKGSGKPKIAYVFYDNPAGREPLPILEDLAKRIGFEYQTYAVPPPGIDMRPQILDATRKFRADWVISHLFGRGPSVTIKELSRVRFPIDHLISFVWGSGESDMNAAGWDTAEGYYGLQFTGIGQNHEILEEIRGMYKDEGKPAPESMKSSVYYNRGVFTCALHAEAIRRAVEKHGEGVTPEQVKDAMETIDNFDLGGFLPPLKLSKRDHEGGGWVKVYQTKGGKFVEASDWFRGFPEVVAEHVWGK